MVCIEYFRFIVVFFVDRFWCLMFWVMNYRMFFMCLCVCGMIVFGLLLVVSVVFKRFVIIVRVWVMFGRFFFWCLRIS